jgi:hypothetical protein
MQKTSNAQRPTPKVFASGLPNVQCRKAKREATEKLKTES